MKIFIKPNLKHSQKGRKIIKNLNLKTKNGDVIKVTYEELEKFLIKENLNQEKNENKIKLKLNNTSQYPKFGQKELKSINCKKINKDNQIIDNEIINIDFQTLNHNNYYIEIYNNNNLNNDEKIKILNEMKDLNKKQLNSNNIYSISNILEWSANITNLAAGASGLIPGSGSIISPILTMTSASCSIFNSYIKDKKNNSIENITTQINNIEITEQPSTSTGTYNSNFSTIL